MADEFDLIVAKLLLVNNPSLKTCKTATCALLSERSTQIVLLGKCKNADGSDNKRNILALMYYLDSRGVHMKHVIVDIKSVDLALSLRFCMARLESCGARREQHALLTVSA